MPRVRGIKISKIPNNGNIEDRKKNLLLLANKYYKNNKEGILLVKQIIDGKHKISLRLLDYFVSKYSKKFKVIINDEFIYYHYKTSLKTNSKILFDPFRRDKKIIYEFDEEIKMETTIGQLIFFRWALRMKIIPYIMENIKAIELNMNVDKDKRKNKQKQ